MQGNPGSSDFPKATKDYVNCPQCGCPNRQSDTACSFCGASLSGRMGISARLRRAVETIKWRYRIKSPRSGHKHIAKKFASNTITLLLGAALTSIGAWFIIKAVNSSSFSDFLVGTLFALYGVYSIYYILGPGGKDRS